MGRGVITAENFLTERVELEQRTSDPASTAEGELWLRTDIAPDAGQIATVRLDRGGSTVDLPVYDVSTTVPGDVRKMFRVRVGGATGFVPFKQNDGAYSFVRLQHESTWWGAHDTVTTTVLITIDSGSFETALSEAGVVHDGIGGHPGESALRPGWRNGNLAEDLIAYWPLDGDANDRTELGNDGTVNGATFNGGGHLGADHLVFDGSDDYVDTPATLSLDGGDDATLALWFNADDSSTTQTLFGVSGDGSEINRILISSGEVLYNLRDENGNGYTDAGGPISTSTWYHVVGVYNSTEQELRCYIDGSLAQSATFTGSVTTTLPFYIGVGSRAGGANDGNWFDGQIDDVRLYDRAMSLPEIEALAARRSTQEIATGDTL